MGYQTLFIHNDEKSLINTTHIGQFFAFKPYLLPISQSICILIFFPFQTWFQHLTEQSSRLHNH